METKKSLSGKSKDHKRQLDTGLNQLKKEVDYSTSDIKQEKNEKLDNLEKKTVSIKKPFGN